MGRLVRELLAVMTRALGLGALGRKRPDLPRNLAINAVDSSCPDQLYHTT